MTTVTVRVNLKTESLGIDGEKWHEEYPSEFIAVALRGAS